MLHRAVGGRGGGGVEDDGNLLVSLGIVFMSVRCPFFSETLVVDIVSLISV